MFGEQSALSSKRHDKGPVEADRPGLELQLKFFKNKSKREATDLDVKKKIKLDW